jgi:glucose-1-phosphate thymidylyltransferase
MKGIILAGGSGSRLWPITASLSKQMLPVYDKPLVYYPLGTLMLSGIRDILIITTPKDQDQFRSLLGDGSNFGISISYETQDRPAGIAEAFIIGREFIGSSNVCLILGDNIFYGQGLGQQLQTAESNEFANIFAYSVVDPQRYGVVEFDSTGKIQSIEEKPPKPKSHFVIPGLYFFPNNVVEIVKGIIPSDRGELEITDLLKEYLKQSSLRCQTLGRGTAWFDTGTVQSLNDASNFLRVLDEQQGIKICVPEEIALHMGYISEDDLRESINGYPRNSYSAYLTSLIIDRQ